MEAPPWEPVRNDSLPPTLSPAVPPYVKLGLTAVYTAFYALLFVFIYAQLWLVLRYRHKRLSYQSVFLFLCLFWASLRTVLFSFYFRDFVAANSFSPFVFWLLYCFPVCLQFFTLTLMNLYFTQGFLSSEGRDLMETFHLELSVPKSVTLFVMSDCDFQSQVKIFSRTTQVSVTLYLASLFISLVFLLVNLTCAVLVKTGTWERKVIVSGSSVCQVTAIGVTVILLYASRACYNLFILSFSRIKNVHSFDYDWYNVSDQADLKSQLGDAGYVVFGVVLFVWELLPTTLVVYFFRVRNPTKDLTNPGMVPSHGFSPRSYFFDNPRRYDSDDDLAWNVAPQGLQGRYLNQWLLLP
ncbi:hypothetical protein STEG23_019332 [Scotinomys teguina]